MDKLKKLGLVIGSTLLATAAFAQTATPVETVTGASTTAQTAWAAFAGISASAFVFAMVIRFGRKGTK